MPKYAQTRLAECECGRYRSRQARCCRRCAALDGVPTNGGIPYAVFEILQVLRAADRPMSTAEVALELGRDPGDAGVLRMLRRLVNARRARMAKVDCADGDHSNYYILRT